MMLMRPVAAVPAVSTCSAAVGGKVAHFLVHHAPQPNSQAADVTRDELRQLILEELRGLKGDVR